MTDLVMQIHKHNGRLYAQINLGGDNLIVDDASTEIKLMSKIKHQLSLYSGLKEGDYTIRKDYL